MTAIKERLTGYIERIESLEENKKNITLDINEVFKELEEDGFDKKVVKKIISIRKRDIEDVNQEEDMVKVYREALGI